MRENELVLLVLSACDGEIILEKGEMLSEKRQIVPSTLFAAMNCPFGDQQILHMIAESEIVYSAAPVLPFHRQIVPSKLLEARYCPSGDHATVVIGWTCPDSF